MSIKPLLSICIPTYNRAAYLAKSLDSLVCLPEFNSSEVEVVICDNASTDETKKTVRRYSEEYKNIHYYRNSENIKDKNFPTVIKLANGCFRKLCNDTLVYSKDYLSYLLRNIRYYQQDKPFVFFPNHNLGKKQKDKYVCTDINDFLRLCSFYITWLGGFGFWEDELLLVQDWFDGCETSLWQTRVLLEILSKKSQIVVLNKQKINVQDVEKKNLSYGLYNVFYSNYLELLKFKVEEGIVSSKCYNFLKKDLLLNFFSLWTANYRLSRQDYITTKCDNSIEDLLKAEYRRETYFIYYIYKSNYYYCRKKIKQSIMAIIRTLQCID